MRISACVITKNEEKNIGQWLSAMKQVADEIIVVDTGSQDRTVAIATQAGAIVKKYLWQRDFAAAKNYALDQATGDWILFLDADEYFTQESLAKLPLLLKKYQAQPQVGVLLCQLINIDVDRQNKIIDTLVQARVFRRHGDIRYIGKVHEQLHNAGSNKVMQYESQLQILHTGYSTNVLVAKAHRNLGILLEAEGKATPETRGAIFWQLMDAYNVLGNYAQAKIYARKSIANQVDTLGMPGHVYEVLISAMDSSQDPLSEILSVVEEARAKYPQEALFCFLQGWYLWMAKDYLQSEQSLQRGLVLRQKFLQSQRNGVVMNDTSLRVLHVVYGVLGQITLLKNHPEQAVEYFAKGLELYAYVPLLTRGMYQCLAQEKAVDIIEVFQHYYKKQDRKYLLNTIGDILSPELMAYYGKDEEDKSKVFLKTGRYDAAGVASSVNIQEISMLLALNIEQASNQKQLWESTGNMAQRLLPPMYRGLFWQPQTKETPALKKVFQRLRVKK